MMPAALELLLFHRDLGTSLRYIEAGVDAIIVDLEQRGKASRQCGYDTEINTHTLENMRQIKVERPDVYVMCRLNSPVEFEAIIDEIIEAGASEIIVPMITTVAQAERMVRLAESRFALTLMIETPEALDLVEELGQLPAERVYVGLNDLHIARGTRSIFEPLIDGTLDRVRNALRGQGFGFGGLTLPDCGLPLASRHLYVEMARLETSFTFVRRSFYRDSASRDAASALSEIHDAFQLYSKRNPEQVKVDREHTIDAVKSLYDERADEAG